ncbi:hypothetical protein JV173_05660 [Acholeplasma equirhinis]|uniref:hypothetical protein n=1 Tax=Acholeplasma equirhinis TaxID=555393 RepID=UPI00197A8A9A|nr:hypothetical protein [Acholeplasma equirhinis]MBN3491000.1 hypothetical protein [Acholeplasma equirhinis]
MKKFFHFFLEPIRFFGSRDLSAKIVGFFDRHGWLVYVLAFLVALAGVFFKYMYPTF